MANKITLGEIPILNFLKFNLKKKMSSFKVYHVYSAYRRPIKSFCCHVWRPFPDCLVKFQLQVWATSATNFPFCLILMTKSYKHTSTQLPNQICNLQQKWFISIIKRFWKHSLMQPFICSCTLKDITFPFVKPDSMLIKTLL